MKTRLAALSRLAAPCGAALLAGAALSACTATAGPDRLTVLASTDVIADLVDNVAADHAETATIVPAGGDPHSYEPSPQDTERITTADAVFTNGMLLEENSITKLVASNVPDASPWVALAEESETYGATLIPMEEDLGLDVLWLGLAVQGGDGDATDEVALSAVDMTGPGRLVVYLTDGFGTPEIYFDSGDGFDADDEITLPFNAHTHVNWAFTEPGVYELTMAADVDGDDMGEAVFTFSVGDGTDVDGLPLTIGHADITADLDRGEPIVRADAHGDLAAADVALVVPDKAIEPIPDSELYEFLGEPGEEVWLLPQAVLGKHVHGEIDPHLWHDVANAKAYVQIIADTLTSIDPGNSEDYHANAREYLATLDELHSYVSDTVAMIPPEHRKLVTTHDAFGYFAAAYDFDIAGFVVPNPAAEPSAQAVEDLARTIDDLAVPAVFAEPNLAARADVLRQVAADVGAQVCVINGDVLSDFASDYVSFMRHNADELARCLA